jgi:hypothetical protein
MLLMKRTNNVRHRTLFSLGKAALSFGLLAGLAAASSTVACPSAFAQKNAPLERIAQGKVVNKAGSSIAGAVVYLKDSRSNAVKTYIADNEGHFRFGDLSQNTDYELWAESNGVRSKSKAISSFDSENNFNFTLKVDSAK